jgi:outer membrane protein
MQKQILPLLMAISLLLGANKADAQQKLAYVNLREVIKMMPEFAKASEEMAAYQQVLQQQANGYDKTWDSLQWGAGPDAVELTGVQKEKKRQQLNEAYRKADNFAKQEAPKLLQQRDLELMTPIQQKAIATIQAVARENGITHVFNKEELVAFPLGDDLLPLIALKLNLTLNKPDTLVPETAALSQTSVHYKLGCINLQELIIRMPEYKQAGEMLAEYEKALLQNAKEAKEAYERADSLFTSGGHSTSSLKIENQGKLREAYLKADQFGPEEAQKMRQQKEQELMEPLRQKAIKATQAVARENGIDHVLSKEQLIVFPPGDDLSLLVAKKLGITLGKPDAAAPGIVPL